MARSGLSQRLAALGFDLGRILLTDDWAAVDRCCFDELGGLNSVGWRKLRFRESRGPESGR
jgi:hypothetical protein